MPENQPDQNQPSPASSNSEQSLDSFVSRIRNGKYKPEDISILSDANCLDSLVSEDKNLLKKIIIDIPNSGTVIRDNLYLQELLGIHFESRELLEIATTNVEAGEAILEIEALYNKLDELDLEQFTKVNPQYIEIIRGKPALLNNVSNCVTSAQLQEVATKELAVEPAISERKDLYNKLEGDYLEQSEHEQVSTAPVSSDQNYFSSLPVEVFLHIFSFLSPQVNARSLALSDYFRHVLSVRNRWIAYLKQETNYELKDDENPFALFGILQRLKRLSSLRLSEVWLAANKSDDHQERALILFTPVLLDRLLSESANLLKKFIIDNPDSGIKILNNPDLQKILGTHFSSDKLRKIATRNVRVGKAILKVADLYDKLDGYDLKQLCKVNSQYVEVIFNNPTLLNRLSEWCRVPLIKKFLIDTPDSDIKIRNNLQLQGILRAHFSPFDLLEIATRNVEAGKAILGIADLYDKLDGYDLKKLWNANLQYLEIISGNPALVNKVSRYLFIYELMEIATQNFAAGKAILERAGLYDRLVGYHLMQLWKVDSRYVEIIFNNPTLLNRLSEFFSAPLKKFLIGTPDSGIKIRTNPQLQEILRAHFFSFDLLEIATRNVEAGKVILEIEALYNKLDKHELGQLTKVNPQYIEIIRRKPALLNNVSNCVASVAPVSSDQNYFLWLPKEIFLHIFSFLSPQVNARSLASSKYFRQILSDRNRWIAYLKQETNYELKDDDNPLALFGKLQILKRLPHQKLREVWPDTGRSNNLQEKALILSTPVLFKVIFNNLTFSSRVNLRGVVDGLRIFIINSRDSDTAIRKNLYCLQTTLENYFKAADLINIAISNFKAGTAILEIDGLYNKLDKDALRKLVEEDPRYFKIILNNPVLSSKLFEHSDYRQFYLFSNLKKVVDPIIDGLAEQMWQENGLTAVIQQWMALVEDKPLAASSSSVSAKELQELLKSVAELPYIWPEREWKFLNYFDLTYPASVSNTCQAMLPIYIKQDILKRIKKIYQEEKGILQPPIPGLNEQWLAWQQQKLEATKPGNKIEFDVYSFGCIVFTICTVVLPIHFAIEAFNLINESLLHLPYNNFGRVFSLFLVSLLSLIGLPFYAVFIASLPVMALGLAATKISTVVRNGISSFIANKRLAKKYQAYMESLQVINNNQPSQTVNPFNPYTDSNFQPDPLLKGAEQATKEKPEINGSGSSQVQQDDYVPPPIVAATTPGLGVN